MIAEPQTLIFGDWLKRRRKGLDLTREKLAWRVGCSFETIKKIEAGELKPSAQLAELLAAKLDVPETEREAFIQFARSGGQVQVFAFTGLPVAASFPDIAPPALPAPVTGLFGREREIHAARALLKKEAVRLFTLTGPPGAGKTRLSLALAEHLREEFADGAAFVPLAAINDPSLVLPAIAHVLHVPPREGEFRDDALFETLRPRQLLLILDNFEQVISAAPRINDLLRAAPRLKIIVSSREALRVYGEHEFPVPPLDVPDVKHLPPVEALTRYSAVELFVERARAVKPDFELTAENAEAVARICALLDGLPLALEMAAVQLRRSSPARVLGQLESKLVALGSGMRDLSPRQQTLRGALDWSYDLLADREQLLFEYLSVFVGSATYAAVQAILPPHDESLSTQLETTLESLVDKNLLRMEQGSGKNARYGMLDLIREYAREKLSLREERDVVGSRHANYFCALAHEILSAADVQYENLEREYDNLRAALLFAATSEDVLLALRLCRALGPFWQARGYWREGLDWTRRALAFAKIDSAEYLALRADALQLAAQLAERQEGDVLPRSMYLESLELRRAGGDEHALAEGLAAFSTFQYMHGEHDAAREYAQEALSLARALDDAHLTAQLLTHLGRLELARTEPLAARVYLQESLLVSRAANNASDAANALYNLGNAALHDGKFQEAEELHRQALALLRARGDLGMVRRVLVSLGMCAIGQDDFAGALDWTAESLELAHALHDRYGEAYSLHTLGMLEFWQGHLTDARENLETSLRLASEIGVNTGAARLARTSLGYLDLAQGNLGSAQAAGEEMSAAWRGVRDLQGQARALGLLGYAAIQGGDLPRARDILEPRLALARAAEQFPGIAEGLFDLAYLGFKQHAPAQAGALLRELLRAAMAAGSISWVALSVMGLALVDETGDARRTVQLYHLNAMLFAKIRMSRSSLPRMVQEDIVQSETRARHQLDAETLAQVWRETQEWSLDRVYEYARSESRTASGSPRRRNKK